MNGWHLLKYTQIQPERHWMVEQIEIQIKRKQWKKERNILLIFRRHSWSTAEKKTIHICCYVFECWIWQRFWICQHCFDSMVIRNVGSRVVGPSTRMYMKFNTQQFRKSQLFLEFYLNNKIFVFLQSYSILKYNMNWQLHGSRAKLFSSIPARKHIICIERNGNTRDKYSTDVCHHFQHEFFFHLCRLNFNVNTFVSIHFESLEFKIPNNFGFVKFSTVAGKSPTFFFLGKKLENNFHFVEQTP